MHEYTYTNTEFANANIYVSEGRNFTSRKPNNAWRGARLVYKIHTHVRQFSTI